MGSFVTTLLGAGLAVAIVLAFWAVASFAGELSEQSRRPVPVRRRR